jgi:hypothetical protein
MTKAAHRTRASNGHTGIGARLFAALRING